MLKGLKQDARRKVKRAGIVFAVCFSTAMLGLIFGENLQSGTMLGNVVRGSALIGMVSGFYIWIVTAWNYNPDSDH